MFPDASVRRASRVDASCSGGETDDDGMAENGEGRAKWRQEIDERRWDSRPSLRRPRGRGRSIGKRPASYVLR